MKDSRINITLVLLLVFFLISCGLHVTPTPYSDPEETNMSNNHPSAKSTEVTWDEALAILNSGEVKLVSQSHNLEVSLTLQDGSRITTIEPSIDAIFKAVELCGDPCSHIILVTE